MQGEYLVARETKKPGEVAAERSASLVQGKIEELVRMAMEGWS